MTTTSSSLLAFDDWTLDINWCTTIVGMTLLKIIAFFIIAFPILVLIWIFVRDQFCPVFAEGMDAETEAAPLAETEPVKAATRIDEKLGLIYESKPQEIDDLKHITGVAGVLEAKLHDFGVYRYSQVANWTDGMSREFGERLSFADRVFRDNWREQCSDLHRKKYGSDPS